MNYNIVLVLGNIFLFFLLVKNFFYARSIAIFLTIIFSILPWYIQLSQFEKGKMIALILTAIFFLIIYRAKKRLSFAKIFPVILLFILPSLILTTTKEQINNLPFPLKSRDVEKIIIYRGFLDPINPTFSRLYSNKATVVLKKLKINFFESADISNYFFATHPLERVGVKENEKFYSSLLPLFVLGLLHLKFSPDGPIILWIGFLLFLSSFVSNRYLGINSLLIIPFLLIIGRGLEKIMAAREFQKKLIILLPIFTGLALEIIIFSLRSNLFF